LSRESRRWYALRRSGGPLRTTHAGGLDGLRSRTSLHRRKRGPCPRAVASTGFVRVAEHSLLSEPAARCGAQLPGSTDRFAGGPGELRRRVSEPRHDLQAFERPSGPSPERPSPAVRWVRQPLSVACQTAFGSAGLLHASRLLSGGVRSASCALLET